MAGSLTPRNPVPNELRLRHLVSYLYGLQDDILVSLSQGVSLAALVPVSENVVALRIRYACLAFAHAYCGELPCSCSRSEEKPLMNLTVIWYVNSLFIQRQRWVWVVRSPPLQTALKETKTRSEFRLPNRSWLSQPYSLVHSFGVLYGILHLFWLFTLYVSPLFKGNTSVTDWIPDEIIRFPIMQVHSSKSMVIISAEYPFRIAILSPSSITDFSREYFTGFFDLQENIDSGVNKPRHYY